jgi:hypothetical protein
MSRLTQGRRDAPGTEQQQAERALLTTNACGRMQGASANGINQVDTHAWQRRPHQQSLGSAEEVAHPRTSAEATANRNSRTRVTIATEVAAYRGRDTLLSRSPAVHVQVCNARPPKFRSFH